MALCDRIRAPGRSPLPHRVLLLLCFTGFSLAASAGLHAATISGTVKDPSGAVIAQARIEVRGGDLAQPVVFFSDGLGRLTITQSEVDEHFAMLVPVFADFGQGMVRLGQVEIEGNNSFSGDVLLPRQPKKVALNAYKDILER